MLLIFSALTFVKGRVQLQASATSLNNNRPGFSNSFTIGPPQGSANTWTSPNTNFIALLEQNSVPLTRTTNNTSIKRQIYGQNLTFLIDTGTVTAIRADVWRRIPELARNKPEPTPIDSIKAVSGAVVPVLGQLQLPFQIENHTYSFKALVIASLTYEAILGRDFLEYYKAKIDLEQQTLCLGADSFSFPAFEGFSEAPVLQPPSYSIHAQSTFLVPPRSEILVPAVIHQDVEINSVGIVDPRDELAARYNLIGGATLVKVSTEKTIPFRLLNPTNQPIKIYRCTRLGELKPLTADIATFELLRSDIEAETTREVPMATDTDPHTAFDLNNTDLTPEQQTSLRTLLHTYDVFAYNAQQLGKSSVVKHTIDTGDHPPIRLRSYRTPPASKDEIDKQVHIMLETGIISALV